MKGKKILFVLLFVMVCLLTVGCGKDSKESGKKSSKEKTLECTTKMDEGSLVISITQNTKTYELTKGTVSGKVDISDYKDAVEDSYWESAYCDTIEESMPFKKCTAKVSGNDLKIDVELDMEKYVKQLQDEGEIDDLDKDTLNDLKESAEDDGGTCKIS